MRVQQLQTEVTDAQRKFSLEKELLTKEAEQNLKEAEARKAEYAEAAEQYMNAKDEEGKVVKQNDRGLGVSSYVLGG